jgi:chemotaxis protein MotC
MSRQTWARWLAPALLVPLLVSTLVASAKADTSSPPQRSQTAEPASKRVGREPVLLVMQLAETQLKIARGDNAAFERQGAVAEDVAHRMAALDPSVWSDARNREALIKFVLSGGNPALLGKLVKGGAIPPEESTVAKGALAFATDDRENAANLLGDVEHAKLASSLAGHVALVKAALVAGSDAKQAIELCYEARLLSPGTHIEETALRLTTELAIKIGDEKSFEAAATGYLFRFPTSTYGRAFVPRVARVMGSLDYLQHEKSKRRLATMISMLSLEQQADFHLELAESALRSGKLGSAVTAAGKVLEAEPAGSAKTAKARAILGAARIAAGEHAEGRRDLAALQNLPPGSELEALARAALRIADYVTATPERAIATEQDRTTAAVNPSDSSGAGPQRGPDQMGKVSGIVANAKAQLAEATKLIEGGSR